MLSRLCRGAAMVEVDYIITHRSSRRERIARARWRKDAGKNVHIAQSQVDYGHDMARELWRRPLDGRQSRENDIPGWRSLHYHGYHQTTTTTSRQIHRRVLKLPSRLPRHLSYV